MLVCAVDLAADGMKQTTVSGKMKDKEQTGSVAAEEKEAVKVGEEGASVEVKEEESKDGVEVKPNKEKLSAVEAAADSKPAGDKYSPKVSLSPSYSAP